MTEFYDKFLHRIVINLAFSAGCDV